MTIYSLGILLPKWNHNCIVLYCKNNTIVFTILLTIAKIWKQPMSTDKKVLCVCIYTYINIFIRVFLRPLRKLRIIVNEEQDNIGLLKNVIEMPVPFSSSFKSQFTGLYLWETAFDSSRWRYFSCIYAVFVEFLQHAMKMLLLHVYRWVFRSVQQYLRRV